MQYVVKDVLAHYGVDTRSAQGNVLTVLCPFHDDNNPSGKIDLATGYYNCWSCNRHTTVLAYISAAFKKPIRDVYFTVGNLDSTPSKYVTEDPANVELWHVTLFSTPELLAQLYLRCVTDEQIRLHRLGALLPGDEPPEIRIPIRNKRGDVIAVKSYRPGMKEGKFLWRQGLKCNKRNSDKEYLLFPVEQLSYHSIVIFGGEIKAIAASSFLNQYEIGAVSGTGSETVKFSVPQLEAFRNKIVYVCYDIDETGVNQSLKLCRSLRHYAESIHLVKLPLDIAQYPHGDVNDFLAAKGDLYQLIKDTPVWEYEAPSFSQINHVDESEPPIETTLYKAVAASMAKKKVKIKTTVSSMDSSPFSIPKDIKVYCDRNFSGCSQCLIFEEFSSEVAEVHLSAERIEIIEMVNEKLDKQERVLKKAFGIPARCLHVSFSPQTFYNVEDLRVSQHLDIKSRANERSMQAAYVVGEGRIELNECYTMTGRMYPHPTTQQATLLITEFDAVQDALSTYTPSNLEALEVFRPVDWNLAAIEDKLEKIYDDLSTNVTNIYGRQDLHLLYDLAFHSVLFFPNGLKGWIEVLVVGDSAQGKSLCADRLIEHYGLGERVICKGSTVPGLLGGVAQHGSRWFVTWGKIPVHDRRLVVLDEVKGTSPQVIAGLTDMRSRGIAEITKIEKRRTNARTRLIWISNPRSERVIKEYNTGIDVIRELIGSPEDVRRFDAIMIVAQKEVPDTVIHQRDRPAIQHVYTSELCRELVLFAWTVPNVAFEDINYLCEQAMELTSEYVEDVPIVDSGSMREKLMRLATSLAVRTFSISSPDTVYVRNCHVDYILKYLRRLYSSPMFGYAEYSRKKLSAERLVDPQAIKIRLTTKVPFPKELIYAFLTSDAFDIGIIQDILGWPVQEARDLLAFLNRQHALKQDGKMYRKTAAFYKLLKELENDPGVARPPHIPEDF